MEVVRKKVSNKELLGLIDNTLKILNRVKRSRKQIKDLYSTIDILDANINNINKILEALDIAESELRQLAFCLCYIKADTNKRGE
jgi:prefoldin subunit 5